MKWGLDLAAAQINAAGGVMGRKLELVYEDEEANPAVATQKAEKLFQVGKVDFLTGTVNSGSTLAVGQVAERNNRLIATTVSFADSITADKCSPNVFRVNARAGMQSAALADWMASTQKNANVFYLRPDYEMGNIFFESIMDADDDFFDKCIEGAHMFALNQGEICTCPSRLLVQESIYDKFIERVIERTKAIKMGHPLDPSTMIGAQASNDQYEKILSYLKIGVEEGCEVLTGGVAAYVEGLEGGFYIQPTILKGNNKMRVFQEEIFGPVLCVTTFKDEAEALEIANDTLYGLGSGVWTRDMHQAFQISRGIKAGRVWVNCYHAYPAHAPFEGYQKSQVLVVKHTK